MSPLILMSKMMKTKWNGIILKTFSLDSFKVLKITLTYYLSHCLKEQLLLLLNILMKFSCLVYMWILKMKFFADKTIELLLLSLTSIVIKWWASDFIFLMNWLHMWSNVFVDLCFPVFLVSKWTINKKEMAKIRYQTVVIPLLEKIYKL